jgi:hypothetical protein
MIVMAKNAGHIVDSNWEGEWRFWDYLGWLPYPIWYEHVVYVFSGCGPAMVEWVDRNCPEQHRSQQRPRSDTDGSKENSSGTSN